MNKKRKLILLVDDEQTIIETLSYNLKRQGFDTAEFISGQTLISKLNEMRADLIILDWMLPDVEGPEICRLIRQRGIEAPILMLTGRANPNDVAKGLMMGADDYLAKPFSIVELMARVQALLRRSQGQTSQRQLVVGDLVLDVPARRVTLSDVEIDLSPKEFTLLKVLMENAGRTMTLESLLNKVWGIDFAGGGKTVAVHMRWLRQKLEDDPRNPKLLETVHRSGYRLNLSSYLRSRQPIPNKEGK